MSKKYKDVKVTYERCYFDIEIDDEELEFAKRCGIDIEDDDELVKFHLDNDFAEHQDLLSMNMRWKKMKTYKRMAINKRNSRRKYKRTEQDFI